MIRCVPPAREQPSWFLKPLQIEGLPETIELQGDGVSLGRSETNSIVVPEHGFPYVSSAHARVHLLDGTPFVEDLGSKNGTLVNGRRVERSQLRSGDVIQLGNMGPRFVVTSDQASGDTMPTVHYPGQSSRQTRDFSQSTMLRIKNALGIPHDEDVGTFIERKRGNGARAAWAAMVVVALAAGATLWVISDQSSAEAETLAEIRDAARELERREAELDRQTDRLRSDRERLEQESRQLADRIAKLEESAASAAELGELTAELTATQRKLEMFDPVNVRKAELRDVGRVTRAVVFIETKTYLRHAESGQMLHVLEHEDGTAELNLEGNGTPYASEGSGSGFVVTDQGWVITNAHVVEASEQAGFDSVVELNVVFSGTSHRHPARLIEAIFEDDCDLALLKIEPFEEMPHIPSIDVDVPLPPPTSEVFLSGFPLGKMAVQQGETLIASTFKGILSRVVEPYFQVDAAVHPGNSGGPVIDGKGRIIGVVTRVQRTPRGPYASAIGYITPAAQLRRIWPPPDPAQEK